MKAQRIRVLVERGPMSSIPTDIFAHELKVLTLTNNGRVSVIEHLDETNTINEMDEYLRMAACYGEKEVERAYGLPEPGVLLNAQKNALSLSVEDQGSAAPEPVLSNDEIDEETDVTEDVDLEDVVNAESAQGSGRRQRKSAQG